MSPARDDDRGRSFAEEREAHFASHEHQRAMSRVETRGSDDAPPSASVYSRGADVSDLVTMLQKLTVGSQPPPPPSPDWWKHASIVISAGALMLTVIGSAIAIVQSNTRLYDTVETIGSRLKVVEDRQTVNMPRLDAQVAENKAQADTINAIRESVSEERKQRGADGIENRKALQDIMGLISKLADKLADIDKAVAVMQAPGRRSDLGQPERDAQVQGPQFHPR